MSEKRLRVALFGRFYSKKDESIQSQKEKLREAAKSRNYVIIDEFWEENIPINTPMDERTEMKRFIKSVWMDELDIDGLFLTELSNLGWDNRKDHITLTTLFEHNEIAIITLDEIYNPNDWLAGLSF